MNKELTSEEALNYLEDMAYGRKMKLIPYQLKQIIEKELQAFKNIKDTIKEDLKKYIKLKKDSNNPFMTHYYQGKIDYINQLAIFDEELLKEVLKWVITLY